MADIHIEEFYHDIACVLASLYNNFPRPATLYVEDISGPDSADEYGLHSERHLSCFSSMLWLKQHGFIHIEDTIRQEAVDQASLSQKSFLILNARAEICIEQDENELAAMPDYVAQAHISNIHVLRQAIKSQSSIKISAIALHILQQV